MLKILEWVLEAWITFDRSRELKSGTEMFMTRSLIDKASFLTRGPLSRRYRAGLNCVCENSNKKLPKLARTHKWQFISIALPDKCACMLWKLFYKIFFSTILVKGHWECPRTFYNLLLACSQITGYNSLFKCSQSQHPPCISNDIIY